MTTNDAKERLGRLFWDDLQIKHGKGDPELVAELNEITAELQSLDAQSTSILMLRYRSRLPFKDIAKAIHYSVAQTRRLHDAAVEKYRKAQEERNPENV